MLQRLTLALLAVPVGLAARALFVGEVVFKMAVPLSVAGVVIISWMIAAALRASRRITEGRSRRWARARWWRIGLVLALVVSAVGDFFMSTVGETDSGFSIGLGFYLLAHIAYAAMAITRGRLHRGTAAVGGVLVGAYVLLILFPATENTVIAVGTMVYALATVVSLAAAVGIRDPGRWIVTAAIALIFFSDLLIAQNRFVGATVRWWLVQSTYYGAHLLFGYDALSGAFNEVSPAPDAT